ncbi:interleukin-18-like [Xenopus laevis]|uniref:Interleukin-18 n=2 Tax=Xenopus laevis TaxID=8355 RepID=A0A974CFX7_XENLA|nr:interleukin-18-like [Xenopus laevis]OCT72534.1 hypothetical protein XELAEV_18035513mg [Xenopus laevis]
MASYHCCPKICLEDEVDGFRLDKFSQPTATNLKNCMQHLLTFVHDVEPFAIFLPDENTEEHQAIFLLHKYRENCQHQNGLAVVFSKCSDNKMYVLCSSSCGEISFKEREIPNNIQSQASECIFYQRTFSDGSSSLRFESSVKKNFYLACEETESFQKLILKYCPPGNLDETIAMYISILPNYK